MTRSTREQREDAERSERYIGWLVKERGMTRNEALQHIIRQGARPEIEVPAESADGQRKWIRIVFDAPGDGEP
jgi:hypothetical protein